MCTCVCHYLATKDLVSVLLAKELVHVEVIINLADGDILDMCKQIGYHALIGVHLSVLLMQRSELSHVAIHFVMCPICT